MRVGQRLSIRQAAAVQFASKYSNVAVQLVITMVLARLVTPEEFGVVAMLAVFTNFFALLSDMGVSSGIVQYKELDDRDMSGLFLFSVALAFALAVLFAAISVPAAAAFGEEALPPLFALASIGVFFATLNSVPNGMLLREKRFVAIGLRLVVVNAVTGSIAIAMAFAGAGCYALVSQFVLSSVFVFVWSFAASGLRVRRTPVLEPLRTIFGFSAYQAAHGFVNYFSRNMDNLLVGLAFGSSALGFYDKAYRLSTYPVSGFTSVVSSVLHPYLSDWQDRPAEIYARFVDLTRSIFAVGVLVSALGVAASDEAVLVLFGDQWSSSGPLFMALSVSVMFQMVTSLTGSVFQSLGRTREMFLSTVVNTAITVVVIALGVASRDLFVLASLVSLSYCLNPVATYYFLVSRAFRMSLRDFARAMAPQLAVAAAMLALAIAVRLLAPVVVLSFDSIVPLVAKALVISAAYAALLAVTGQYRHLRTLFRR